MSKYYVYLDETGDFLGDQDFYAISGFVWDSASSELDLKSEMHEACRILREKMIMIDPGHPHDIPFCLHTSDMKNNSSLRKYLSDKKDPPKDPLKNLLGKLPVSLTCIYAFRSEIDQEDFDRRDLLYRIMMLELIRGTTEAIRGKDPDAEIDINIPSRQATFQNLDVSEEYRRAGIRVTTEINAEGSLYKVDVNEPHRFLDIGHELNIACPVRSIQYDKAALPNEGAVDKADETYHRGRDGNPDSTLWGYYIADVVNFWIKGIVNKPQQENETIRRNLSSRMPVTWLCAYSKYRKKMEHVLSQIHQEPLSYLETLCEYTGCANNSKRIPELIKIMEESNPFTDETSIQLAVSQTKKNYIYQNNYDAAIPILEKLICLADAAHSAECDAYHDGICELMSLKHHLGENTEAFRLFRIAIDRFIHSRVKKMKAFNKVAEFFVDTLSFEEGILLIENLVAENKKAPGLTKMGNLVIAPSAGSTEDRKEEARCLSTLGSLYAYTGESDKAKEKHKEAMRFFSGMSDGINENITRSHDLHAKLDSENAIISAEFLKEADRYFTGRDSDHLSAPLTSARIWEEWLTAILIRNEDNGHFNASSARFDFWLFFKMLYFALPHISGEEKDSIWCLLDEHRQAITEVLQLSGHPVEMIIKYLALIRFELDKRQSGANAVIQLQQICTKYHDHGIIPLLCRMGEYRICAQQGLAIPNAAPEVLLRGIREDLQQLRNEVDDVLGTDREKNCLIDRLCENKDLSLQDVEKEMRYEFR